MNTFKKSLVSGCALCIIIAVIDILVGKIGDSLISRLPDFAEEMAKDNYRLNRVMTDIIIVGSSRGCHHYVTRMLGDSIKQYTHNYYTIYNASIDGQYVTSSSCAIESILKRYTPQLLILEVSENEFTETGHEFSDVRFSEPHYTSNPTVRQYVNEISWTEKVKVLSNMYRYNGKLLRIASAFLFTGDESGYEPVFGKMQIVPGVQVYEKSYEQITNPFCTKVFTRMLDFCRKNEIHIILVSSPRFRPKDDNTFVKNECVQRDIPYIDLYNVAFFNDNAQLFKDSNHLNDEGAHIYTRMFFEKLKPYIDHLIY